MYQVVFTKRAEKDFDRLEREIQERVVRVLERINFNPRKYSRKLIGTDFHRVRVGKYKIIIFIDDGENRIAVLRIAHRSQIYEDFGY